MFTKVAKLNRSEKQAVVELVNQFVEDYQYIANAKVVAVGDQHVVVCDDARGGHHGTWHVYRCTCDELTVATEDGGCIDCFYCGNEDYIS